MSKKNKCMLPYVSLNFSSPLNIYLYYILVSILVLTAVRGKVSVAWDIINYERRISLWGTREGSRIRVTLRANIDGENGWIKISVHFFGPRNYLLMLKIMG